MASPLPSSQLTFVFVTVLCVLHFCVASPTATSTSVSDRGLLTPSLTCSLVADQAQKYHKHLEYKHFEGASLVYVTPWNSHGYTIAELFARKFTHVSPVWYQLKLSKGNKGVKIAIKGGHDADENWMNRVRSSSVSHATNLTPTKIVPRLMVEPETAEMYAKLLDKKIKEGVFRKIGAEIRRRKLDGIVLEMTDAWMVIARMKPEMRKQLNQFVNDFAKYLHTSNKDQRYDFILVIRPPQDNSPYFNHKDFLQTHTHVDGYSLMTYDFSSGSPSVGPNAPLPWVASSIRTLVGSQLLSSPSVTSKVWVGLNFYGQKWEKGQPGQAILGRDVLKLIESDKKCSIKWDAQSAEHTFSFPASSTTVAYPTPNSIHERVELARKMQTGISVWEIGQGMEYFYDLF